LLTNREQRRLAPVSDFSSLASIAVPDLSNWLKHFNKFAGLLFD
jgi:hypothetical protein